MPGKSCLVRIRPPTGWGVWWFREALGDEGELPRSEDVGRRDLGMGGLLGEGGELRPLSDLKEF